jgi:Divergent InlB B-repeat domain
MAETPAGSGLYWSGPILVDPGTWPTGALGEMSCASTSLCVALDGANNVVTTTDPAAGNDWAVTHLEGAGNGEGSGLACTSTPLCVAVTGRGSIVTSVDPTLGAGGWTVTALDGGNLISGVSCVSSTLCVAVDEHGNVLSSTDPTGGAGAWTSASVDGGHALNGVSCVTSTLCVTVDDQGHVLSSTDPTGGVNAWSVNDVAGTNALTHVSCLAAPLCVAVEGGQGLIASTDPTGGAGAWVSASGVDASGGVSCASASLCVAIPGDTNAGILMSTHPTGGRNSWVREQGPEEGRFLGSLSCASTSLCVIGDRVGNVAISTQANVLSVSLLGVGLGKVTSTPITCPFVNCSHAVPGVLEPLPITAIACADTFGLAYGPWGTCSLEYPAGNEVALTAAPSSGSVFAGWGGACSGSASCAVTMSSARSISATFMTGNTSAAQSTSAPPRLTGVNESAKRWREGKKLAEISGSKPKKPPLGTTFSFSLNEQASVTFNFTQQLTGRSVRGRCVAQTSKNRHGRSCKRKVTAGALSLTAHAGTNKIAFQGRISRSKRLRPGPYTLNVTATNSAGVSNTKLTFTIVK